MLTRLEKGKLSRSRCRICGNRNKVYTEIFDSNSKENGRIGIYVKCCRCGNRMTYMKDAESEVTFINETNLEYGKSHCMQVGYCPKTGICPLYTKNKSKSYECDGKCHKSKKKEKPFYMEIFLEPKYIHKYK